ncbi:MAG: hypothetical protein H7066_01150 [Cytophagaceae bacterium]|nr:hypothetical protein [Gemmatimonadaceae bacterium]
MSRWRFAIVVGGLLTSSGASGAQGSLPLSPARERGQTVTPVFEGWYKNADGTYSLSFGYFNRNESEVLDVPLGAANFISPAPFNGTQPTQFSPRRHWGVFAVRVPADFGTRRLTWTLVLRGDSVAIPGSLATDWQIDALEGEAGSANTPPRLRFGPSGPEGAGPGGITGGPLSTSVGKALTIDVWATDDGTLRPTISSGGRAGVPVALTWFTHQGPGAVTFANERPKADASGKATTTATFSAPGDYVLRVRANDASGVEAAGHAQCCWSNAFLKVTVTR